MATARERHSVTESYLAEIKASMGVNPRLEENDMKMLHMNAPIDGWREWRTLTYDHNVLADWLVRENEELKKIKEDLENKIKMLSTPFPPYPPTGYPNPSPWPNPLLAGPEIRVRSAVVQVTEPDAEEEAGTDSEW